eukprot:CAMPEP_0115827604 /NCGR_PEP_ID=MMETSP0287-20121206/132_1 /TAXON_ID=412157 /ORGANISM="Chrysochromulina rotalis, Strain UIO044" /LENGTH=60 /DNA_ID=CAMNT_0003280771 /DNA_START=677 /DNA_END=859 /DNA_ORIENTATION=+
MSLCALVVLRAAIFSPFSREITLRLICFRDNLMTRFFFAPPPVAGPYVYSSLSTSMPLVF